MKNLRLAVFIGLLVGIALPVMAGRPLVVIHPDRPALNNARYDYQIALLRLVLKKSGSVYEMRPSKLNMEQGRMLQQLEEGQDIDVAWSMTSRDRERRLRPIRLSIDKGLIGYRIFLVKQENVSKFAQVSTLVQLRAFDAGQGLHWPDTQIMKANGLNVYGASSHENLFKMLESGRFDYFPRSIKEVWDEVKAHPDMELVIEPSILLRYPAAEYFFVNKKNKVLADTLEKGLRIAIKDGSFDKLFTQYYGEYIRMAGIKNRKLIRLKNPLLPKQTQLYRHITEPALDSAMEPKK